MTNTYKTLSKLCYCQSARHARAAVRALESAGYAARADASGYVFVDNPTEAALEIANAAIKAVHTATDDRRVRVQRGPLPVSLLESSLTRGHAWVFARASRKGPTVIRHAHTFSQF
jgi:hypothetical protein